MRNQTYRIIPLIARPIVLALIVLAPQQMLSCPVCYGASDSSMFAGMNFAILTLLGVTGMIFAGVVSFYFYMRKRIKMTLGGSVEPPSLN
jgi:hypothetical protein